MDISQTPDATPLLLTGLGALICLIVLILRFRIHAFVSLTLVSVLTALAAGIHTDEVVPVLLGGFGGTLAAVALLVGLGSMIGKLLEMTGGAQVLADTLISRFGEDKAPLALGIASLLFGFPIFFDAGLIVMIPILMSVAARLGGSTLTYAFPAAGAFAVMHAFVPPHPGPVAASDLLGADIGMLLCMDCWSLFPPGIWVHIFTASMRVSDFRSTYRHCFLKARSRASRLTRLPLRRCYWYFSRRCC